MLIGVVAQPIGMRGFHRRPGIAAAAVELVAFHRDIDVAAARIAGDDLELGAEQIVRHLRVEHRRRTCAGRADGERLGLGACRWSRRRSPPTTNRILLTTDRLPIQLNLRASNWTPGWPSAWSVGVAWLRQAITVPSLRRDRVEPVGRAAAAGAGHVLRHDGRLAGNVRADEAAEHAGIEVVAAAGAVADDEGDALAAIEVGDVVGAGRRGEAQPARLRRPATIAAASAVHRRTPSRRRPEAGLVVGGEIAAQPFGRNHLVRALGHGLAVEDAAGRGELDRKARIVLVIDDPVPCCSPRGGCLTRTLPLSRARRARGPGRGG